MKRIGYGRVSTVEQDTAVQEAALKAAGCSVIFTEKKTGTKRDGREKLATALQVLSEGDVLVVYKLDRLARSLVDLLAIYEDVKAKGAKLEVLDAPWLDGSVHGDMLLGILGSLSQWETRLRRERQLAGIERIKADPKLRAEKYPGRKKEIDDDSIRAMKAQGASVKAIMRSLKVSRASVYRALAQ